LVRRSWVDRDIGHGEPPGRAGTRTRSVRSNGPERQSCGRRAVPAPSVSGAFRIDCNGPDIASGTIVELDRPRRLVLSWGWEAPGDSTPPGASLVEVTFEPDGDGTRLRLHHSGLSDDAVQGHAEGWDQFLPGLAEPGVRD
jgi:uncharacterized protein YndB with AHSA1/START domain